MVKRRVRAKNSEAALKKARKDYPGLTVTGVNWLPKSKATKKGKLYQVKAHKRKVKRKKKAIAW